jgi:hypothetical protein
MNTLPSPRFLGVALVTAALAIGLSGCDKMLEFEPGDVILAEDAINSADDLQRMLNSNYDVLGNLLNGRQQSVAELLTNNMARPYSSLDYTAVWNRETNFFTPTTGGLYTDFYYAIYRANVVIDSFDLVQDLDEATRIRLEAESRFVRAVCHWYLVKMWGYPYGYTADNGHLGVPLRLDAVEPPTPRATVAQVYAQVLSDLTFAKENLPNENGPYASSMAASGFLAHVHFLRQDWSASRAESDRVINSGLYALDNDLDRFEAGSDSVLAGDLINPETVFGIVGGYFAVDGDSLLNDRSSAFRDNFRQDNNVNPQLTFSSDILNLFSLNSADDRGDWIASDGVQHKVTRFDNKQYFNVPLVHLTGLHLLRAMSLAHDGSDLSAAIADINAIRDRAFGPNLNDLPADSDASTVLLAAQEEYRKETLCEGWELDQLKLRGLMGNPETVRDAPWDCPGSLLQFPNSSTTAAGFVLNDEGGCL